MPFRRGLIVAVATFFVLGVCAGACDDENGESPSGAAGESPGGEGGEGARSPRGGSGGTNRGGTTSTGGTTDVGGAGAGGESTGGAAGLSGSGGSTGGSAGGGGATGGSGEGGDGGAGGEECTTIDVPLGDADFDAGSAGWNAYDEEAGAPRPIIVAAATVGITAESAPNVAHLGGVNDARAGMFQSVSLPDGAVSVTLTGFRHVTTREAGPAAFDVLTVQLWEDAPTTTGLVGDFVVLTNGDAGEGWVEFTGTVSVDAYAGRVLELDLWAETDSSLVTEFYVDSLSLSAYVCR